MIHAAYSYADLGFACYKTVCRAAWKPINLIMQLITQSSVATGSMFNACDE